MIRVALLALVCLLVSVGLSAAQSVVYVVRHAEKAADTGDPPLSPEGEARAQALAKLLEHANIRAIYVSEALRAQKTAQPLAEKLGSDVEPKIVTGDYATEIYNDVRAEHLKDAVLIVGHSNTIIPIIQKWSSNADVAPIGNEYDNIFVVVPHGEDAGWVRFKYSAANQ